MLQHQSAPNLKNNMVPLYGWGSTALTLESNYEEKVFLLPLSPQEFLVFIQLTSEVWKVESNLEPPSGLNIVKH